MRKFLALLLFIPSCVVKEPQIEDTRFDESKRDWVAVYENEIRVAIANEDEAAYHFFFRELLMEKIRLYKLAKKKEL